MQTEGKSDRKQKNKLRRGLLTSYLLFALVPMLAFLGMVVFSVQRTVLKDAQELMANAAAARNTQLVQWKNALFSELNSVLLSDEVTIQTAAFLEGLPTQTLTDQYSLLQERLRSVQRENQNFDALFLVNRDGQIILSTNLAQVSGVVNDQPFFTEAMSGPYLQPIAYSSATKRPVGYAARPFANQAGETVGLLVGRINSNKMNEILNAPLMLGESAETYLISSDALLLTNAPIGSTGTRLKSTAAELAVGQKSTGNHVYTNPTGAQVAGAYRWQPDFGVGILAEKSTLEIYRAALPAILWSSFAALLVLAVVAVMATWLSRQIAYPIGETAVAAGKMVDGDFDIVVSPSKRRDEIGLLTGNFNQLAEVLRLQFQDLENQITSAAAQLEVQNQSLQAYSEVTRAATTILDPVILSSELVNLITTHFNMYFTGLFLVDEDRQWAIFQAGSGDAGQALLARNFQLAIGEGSMIGWCIANGRERVTGEADEDLVRQPIPELPHTRSEGAIPMHSHGTVIGALSVQSSEPDAFDEDMINLLQALVDQSAVALENARLFEENRLALESARRAYGSMSHSGWTKLIRTQSGLAYLGTPTRVDQTSANWDSQSQEAFTTRRAVSSAAPDEQNLYSLAIPILAGELVLGTINTFKAAEDGPWSSEEIKLLEEIAAQFGLALESSRLYEESQRRAEYEKITGRVTANIRERLDVEAVLRTAAQEVRQALGLPEVTIRLAPPQVGE